MHEPAPVRWSAPWEIEVSDGEHRLLSDLLVHSFPSTAELFRSGRSWAGARPEFRVVGGRGGAPCAHAAVVRRYVRVERDHAILVGDVGLVAVHPDERGSGLGVALMEEVNRRLDDLELPFGLLTCDVELQPFYRRCGWEPLTPRNVTWARIDGSIETSPSKAMIRYVRSTSRGLPPGSLYRDGQEL